MAKFKISPSLLVGLLIAAFFGISLLLRTYLPYGQIFVGDSIKYGSNDAYFYMRLVDNLANNFPHLTQFDPYVLFPGGNVVNSIPVFHWLIAAIAWIVGLGHPTQHIVDVVGVYLPAIMGALIIIPVFFIGKALFNKWAGVLAAGLMAVFPGEFISRSSLGSGDTPVAETLFTATALAFLILAIKTASQRQLTFSHILKRDWKIILKPLVFSLLAGVFLGLYLATWQGALIFVSIIILYLIIQFIINHLHQKSSDYLCIVGFVSFLPALIIFLLNATSSDISAAMVIAVLVPLVLYGISRFISARGLKTYYYPLVLVGIGAVALVILHFGVHSIFDTLLAKFNSVFFPGGATAKTTIEYYPFLTPQAQGEFATFNAWGNFSTSFFIAPWWLIAGLTAAAILGYIFYLNKKSNNSKSLLVFLIVATALLILLTVQQLPSKYALDNQNPPFIPGIAFISLSILFYLFIKRRSNDQRWYISLGWVVGVLALLTTLMLLTTFRDVRYVAILPLAALIYILFKQSDGDEPHRLFLLWTLIILIITMVSRRYAYYFVVNMALLSGYLSWQVIRLSGINKLAIKPEETTQKELSFSEAPKKRDHYELLGIAKNASFKEIKSAFRKLTAEYHPGPSNTPEAEATFKEINNAYKVLTNPSLRASYDSSRRALSERKKGKSRKESHAIYYVNVLLSIVVVFLFVFCPNIAKAQDEASRVAYALSDGWQAALLWMKDNTPEPMGDPEAYYKLYDAPPPGESFNYPASAYGVLAWWDYGYWITRIAHRIPNTNPSQNAEHNQTVANFFLSQDKATEEEIRKDLVSSYVIADYDIVDSTGKFWALAYWAEQDLSKFYETYFIQYETDKYYPKAFYYPQYYQSTLVRLYNFNGEAVTSENATVLTYEVVKDNNGNSAKLITDAKEFSSYQEALNYMAKEGPTNHVLVGVNPFISPIPLEALSDYKLVYASDAPESLVTHQDLVLLPELNISYTEVPEIKIFEYIGNK
jgi:asparagine N-glycosylation enzyme membrane subunit Stt3